ncbi:hypothetical protein [Latilactobacillus fragifolii]|nr:hypothetical protein [Latilactobacillus fragifolii]
MPFDITKFSDQNIKRWFLQHRQAIVETLLHPTTWWATFNHRLMRFFQ